MSAVGKTPIGFKFIRISSHTTKNIQEVIAEIIFQDIDILSHPKLGSILTVDKFGSVFVSFKWG